MPDESTMRDHINDLWQEVIKLRADRQFWFDLATSLANDLRKSSWAINGGNYKSLTTFDNEIGTHGIPFTTATNAYAMRLDRDRWRTAARAWQSAHLGLITGEELREAMKNAEEGHNG